MNNGILASSAVEIIIGNAHEYRKTNSVLEKQQLEGRYPDAVELNLDQTSTREEITRAKEMVEWLIKTL
jgi:hypothetical protein